MHWIIYPLATAFLVFLAAMVVMSMLGVYGRFVETVLRRGNPDGMHATDWELDGPDDPDPVGDEVHPLTERRGAVRYQLLQDHNDPSKD